MWLIGSIIVLITRLSNFRFYIGCKANCDGAKDIMSMLKRGATNYRLTSAVKQEVTNYRLASTLKREFTNYRSLTARCRYCISEVNVRWTGLNVLN